MIFRSISLFLSFGFAYFHLFIYILPYLTHTRRIEERFVPPIVWDYCDFTSTAFPLRLRLTPRTAASSYQPSTHYRVFYQISYRISIASLLYFYRIASRTSHRRIAHRDCLLEGFTQTSHILY